MSRPAQRDVTALILAAGTGERLGGVAKAFLEYRGRTLLEHAAAIVAPCCGTVLIGIAAAERERARSLLDAPETHLVAGGATRRGTVARLLAAAQTAFVVVHEAARPFASRDLVGAVLDAAGETGAAVAARPFTNRDSVAEAGDGLLARTLVKDRMIEIQTPQAYRTDVLRRAYDHAEKEGWATEIPDSEIVRRAGFPVKLVTGEAGNVKLTYPEDLDLLNF